MEELPNTVKKVVDLLLDAGDSPEAAAASASIMMNEGTIETFLERVHRREPPYSHAYLVKIEVQVHREAKQRSTEMNL